TTRPVVLRAGFYWTEARARGEEGAVRCETSMDKTQIDPGRVSPPRPHQGLAGAPSRALPPGAPAPDGAPELRPLAHYPILRRLGEGGMGAVYLAFDGKHDRQVARKGP